MTDSRISLLIGANIPKAHWVLDHRRAGSNELYAIKSPLGWVILGPMSPITKTTEESKVNCIYSNRKIHDSLEKMFNNEFNDTTSTRRAMSEIDKEALNYMTSSMCLVNGHYQIALPWKSGAPSLPDNHAQAYKRLMSIKHRLETNDSFKAMYVSTMNGYIDNGYAESVPMREQNKTGKNVWYLPHHIVLKNRGAAKLRVVFDAFGRQRRVMGASSLA